MKLAKISSQEILSLFDAPKGSLFNYHTTISSGMAIKKGESKLFLSEAQKLVDVFESKQQLYKCIANLKAQGMVSESQDNKLFISKKGEEQRRRLHEQRRLRLPNYTSEKDENIKIISFDIPEKQRKQRVWLRAALKNLGFEILHQSTWIGKSKLPEEFLDDLAFRGVFKHVTILVVTKTGNYEYLEMDRKKGDK
ncbi:MAG: hypothetical protein R3B52_00085 [Candidatus Paceibacterota bacterium]